MNTLNRRDFLKLAGIVLASGALLPKSQAVENSIPSFADPQIRFGKYLLRGTASGTILASSDEGKTWQKLVSFGDYHTVLQFAQKNGRVYVNLGLGSHDFWLKSADGLRWRAA